MTKSDPPRTGTGLTEGGVLLARVALAIGGGIALIFLAGVAAGYISVVAEHGGADPRDIAIVAGIGLAMAGVAFAIWRFWPNANSDEALLGGPGEARTRQRQRRYFRYLGFAVMIGAVIGAITGVFDRGDGSLFSSDWDKLALHPAIAIVLAAMLLFGFALLPLYGFRTIDEFKREHNLIGFTGGCTAVLAGFPMWAVLHAGGMGSAPDPFGIWMLAFVGMFASYLYARWRL
jgi:hypothetical protein